MSNWIKVKDRMPEDGDEVLVFNEGFVCYCNYYKGEFIFEAYDSFGDNDSEYYRKVTHWQPLPKPPTE